MKRLALGVAVVSVCVLLAPAIASAYTSHPASTKQIQAMKNSAERTQVCGYKGRGANLAGFRTVSYKQDGRTLTWGFATWDNKIGQCGLVFIHAAPHARYNSAITGNTKHVKVSWLPFTWGSSPMDDPSYLNSQFKKLKLGKSPNWLKLAQAYS